MKKNMFEFATEQLNSKKLKQELIDVMTDVFGEKYRDKIAERLDSTVYCFGGSIAERGGKYIKKSVNLYYDHKEAKIRKEGQKNGLSQKEIEKKVDENNQLRQLHIIDIDDSEKEIKQVAPLLPIEHNNKIFEGFCDKICPILESEWGEKFTDQFKEVYQKYDASKAKNAGKVMKKTKEYRQSPILKRAVDEFAEIEKCLKTYSNYTLFEGTELENVIDNLYFDINSYMIDFEERHEENVDKLYSTLIKYSQRPDLIPDSRSNVLEISHIKKLSFAASCTCMMIENKPTSFITLPYSQYNDSYIYHETIHAIARNIPSPDNTIKIGKTNYIYTGIVECNNELNEYVTEYFAQKCRENCIKKGYTFTGSDSEHYSVYGPYVNLLKDFFDEYSQELKDVVMADDSALELDRTIFANSIKKLCALLSDIYKEYYNMQNFFKEEEKKFQTRQEAIEIAKRVNAKDLLEKLEDLDKLIEHLKARHRDYEKE